MLEEVMLRLVTGEEVHYGFCGIFMKTDTILREIKDKTFIKVTDEKGRRLTIFSDKVVGCYIKKE